jgi:hypothetical protein
MLLRSPQWLFLYPGLVLTLLGLIGAVPLAIKPRPIAGILTLDIDALLYFCVAAIVGVQITFFGLFALGIAQKLRLKIAPGFAQRLLALASLGGAVAFGAGLIAAGTVGALYAVFQWGHSSFGALVPSDIMRITIPSVATVAIGTQIVFGAFLLGFIEIE